MSIVMYLLLGMMLGAGSSVMPGPCGLAVLRAATERGLRHALGIGLGAGCGDATYAAVGVIGLGPLLARVPTVTLGLQAMSGVVLVWCGLRQLRARRTRPDVPAVAHGGQRGGVLAGIAGGMATLISNPGALLTWALLVGSILRGTSPLASVAIVLGIGAGSAAWFAIVATFTSRARAMRGTFGQRLTAVASAVLVAGGLLSLARAAHGWLAISTRQVL